jgi:VIT1/CCC1 family predicted Fe2+/Mn2+ transporter
MLGRVLGITFALKLMEKGEDAATKAYQKLAEIDPHISEIAREEEEHEQALLNMIEEERLQYVGSMVLGLNDALVELTGALAGLTLAFQQTRIVAVAGFITGVAASLSMAASEYLSQRADENSTQSPLKSALYTGTAYVLTVLFLIFPYLLFTNPYVCLAFALINAVVVIGAFTFYMSVAKEYNFRHRFLEMVLLSFSVAGVSFLFGLLLRTFFNIEV